MISQTFLFGSAGAFAAAAIAESLVPALPRIASILRGAELRPHSQIRAVHPLRRGLLDEVPYPSASSSSAFPAASVTRPPVTCSPAHVVEADVQLTGHCRRSMAVAGRMLSRIADHG